MRILVCILLALIIIGGCQGATIREEWPETAEPKKRIQTNVSNEVFVPEQRLERINRTLSLLEFEPKRVIFDEKEIFIELFEIIDREARIQINDQMVFIREQEQRDIGDHSIRLVEIARDSVPLPRKSWATSTIDGEDVLLYPDETHEVGNSSIQVDFISEENVGLRLNKEVFTITPGRTKSVDGHTFYIGRIIHYGPTEYDLADGVTIILSRS